MKAITFILASFTAPLLGVASVDFSGADVPAIVQEAVNGAVNAACAKELKDGPFALKGFFRDEVVEDQHREYRYYFVVTPAKSESGILVQVYDPRISNPSFNQPDLEAFLAPPGVCGK